MKGLIDTNILIYASAQTAPEYRPAREFLDRVARGADTYAITWINLGEYLSFTTQSFASARPLLTLAEAIANIGTFLALPAIALIAEGERYWVFLQEILRGAGAVKGSFVHDCRIAAIMQENGVDTIYTRDTEFRRIPQLNVVDPLAATSDS